MKKYAVIDLDDTIVSLQPELMRICNDLAGASISKKEWTLYDVHELYGIPNDVYFKMCVTDRILEDAQPIAKAKRTLDILEEQGFSIVYLTARAWHKDAKAITKKWLAHWFFPKGKLHIISVGQSKADYTKQMIADSVAMVVDDNAEHIQGFVDSHRAKQIYLINQPWNKHVRVLDPYRIDNISEVLKHLL